MKEGNIYAGIAAFFIAATAIHSADNPRPITSAAEVLVLNRVAVLPPKENLLPKLTQTRAE